MQTMFTRGSNSRPLFTVVCSLSLNQNVRIEDARHVSPRVVGIVLVRLEVYIAPQGFRFGSVQETLKESF